MEVFLPTLLDSQVATPTPLTCLGVGSVCEVAYGQSHALATLPGMIKTLALILKTEFQSTQWNSVFNNRLCFRLAV